MKFFLFTTVASLSSMFVGCLIGWRLCKQNVQRAFATFSTKQNNVSVQCAQELSEALTAAGRISRGRIRQTTKDCHMHGAIELARHTMLELSGPSRRMQK